MRRACLILALCALGGCERAMHDMYDQPRYKPLAPGASHLPPAGSVPRAAGDLAVASSGARTEDTVDEERAASAQTMPYPITAALLARGRERYAIYCAPCHSPVGDGDGLVARRGFPHPPSYHIARLRAAPDRHFFDVMTHGYGVMYSYADRVSASDRWAIVAYIRALQLSQNARADALPPAMRARLDRGVQR
ncbi:MAG TPA: cytochrome c [Burkholderiales bacterium]|nr:cytochrome c [Burkholderiales bacterium]